MRQKVWWIVIGVSVGLLALLAACQGEVGPAGAAGPAGATGPVGPAGATGRAGAPAPISPGPEVKLTITQADIPADRKPVVTFKLTDAAGNPLTIDDLDKLAIPGAMPARFTLASLKVDAQSGLTAWSNYVLVPAKGTPYVYQGKEKAPAIAEGTQPSILLDMGGSYREVGAGTYTYTFATVLPENYDRNATHRVGGEAARGGRKYVANATFDFVPAGGEVKVTRLIVATESCNQCHDPLGIHGGLRRDTKLCVTCHTSQNVDLETGNTAEYKNMIHKIHRGRNLPSVKAGQPYLQKGFGPAPVDFSEIGWPQDIRNCTTCHGRAPAGMKAEDYAKLAPNADNYKNNPSRAACGSCHDNIDFATGKARYGGRDHPEAGPQKDDTQCSSCHEADSGKEFDKSVVGAHVIPERSQQLQGVNFTLEKAVVSAGNTPEVTFSIKDNAGKPLNPNDFSYLEITLGHPTTDYAHRITEIVNRIVVPPATFTRTGVLTALSEGRYAYTFGTVLDSTWTGSVGIGMGGYISTTIKGNEGKNVVVREGNVNPVIYASLDGGKAVARRMVVKRENCNQCHLDFGSPAGISIHGGIRRNTEYCILCHNPNHTDEARRPAEKMPPESVQYKYMIHSLHMGEERAVPTEFIGFAAAKTSEVFFPTPGAQRNCAKCHEGTSYTIPLPAGVLPTTVTQKGQVVSVTEPITAACKACHIGRPGFDAHAATMTATFGEACAVCHGRGRDFAVEKVHQR